MKVFKFLIPLFFYYCFYNFYKQKGIRKIPGVFFGLLCVLFGLKVPDPALDREGESVHGADMLAAIRDPDFRLFLIRPETVECLRKAVNTRLGGSFEFGLVLDWLDEAVRLEPDLLLHYRALLSRIRRAGAFGEVCIVARAGPRPSRAG